MESRIVPGIDDLRRKNSGDTLSRIRETEIDPSSFETIEALKEEYDLTTIACKLLSILNENEKIHGADKIGKSMEEIERLFFKSSKEKKRKKSGWGSNRRGGNGRRSSRSGGGQRERNRGRR
jgi:hypothetical protein